MIRIKHKQTDKEILYTATIFFKKNVDLKFFDILEWDDVVQLFSDSDKRISHGKLEKRDAIKLIDQYPLLGYWYEDVPKPGTLTGSIKDRILERNENQIRIKDLLDEPRIIRPQIQEITQPTITSYSNIGRLKKWVKSISIKSIIEMVIAGLIVGLLIYWYHLNSIRK